MKRRTFLTAASTVGIVGVASGATVVSSVYKNISTSVLLEEFNTPTKNVLDKFVADIAENAETVGLDASHAKRMAMPVQIISKESKNDTHSIVYKNKAGNTISISLKNGKKRISIVKD